MVYLPVCLIAAKIQFLIRDSSSFCATSGLFFIEAIRDTGIVIFLAVLA
jgi:hypothetical protein